MVRVVDLEKCRRRRGCLVEADRRIGRRLAKESEVLSASRARLAASARIEVPIGLTLYWGRLVVVKASVLEESSIE